MTTSPDVGTPARPRYRVRGFTLLELLVAVAIFGVIGALALGGLNAVITQETRARAQMDRLAALQLTMRWFTTDLASIQPRFVRDEMGSKVELPLRTDGQGQFLLRLSRGGWSNPASLPVRGTLQRVQYRLDKEELIREYWPTMEHVLGQEPRTQRLLDGVEKLELFYLDDNDDWQPQWPPLRQTTATNVTRPRAIRFVMTLTDLGVIERLVEVAQ